MKSTLNYASRLSLVEHFSGRADRSTLYPFKNQHSDWHRQSGFYERWALFYGDDLNQKNLEHVFRGLDHVGIDVAGQFQAGKAGAGHPGACHLEYTSGPEAKKR